MQWESSGWKYCGSARLLWHLLHVMVNSWYFVLEMADLLESYFICKGILKKYKPVHIGKLRYLAVVVESEDANQISKIVELLEWLVGILKKSKESILAKLDRATLLEDSLDDGLFNQQDLTLEFASFSDGKEAVAKAANVLLRKYSKFSASGKNKDDQIFTEALMTEALKAVASLLKRSL